MSEKTRWERFTVVFEGDIRRLPFNPLAKKSEWGKALACACGDKLLEFDYLQESVDRTNDGTGQAVYNGPKNGTLRYG